MRLTQLESNQAYPIRYTREWRECFNCGGKGTIETEDGEVLCMECEGTQGKWVEVMR